MSALKIILTENILCRMFVCNFQTEKKNFNEAFRLLQEISMSKYTTAIRDIIRMLSGKNNEQQTVERS